MTPRTHSKAAFTVAELLVVIGIVALLLVVTIPAANSLFKSGGRKSAASTLVNGIDQARTQALRDQLNTYFVVPTFSAAAAATVSGYNYRSFAVFEDDPSTANSSGAITGVKQLTKWTTLPTGLAIRSASVGFLVDLSTLVPTVPIFGPDKSTTPTFRCIQFNNNGEVVQPTAGTSTSFDLNIFEGFVSAGGGETFTSAKTSNNPTAIETVRIQRYTGRAEAVQ